MGCGSTCEKAQRFRAEGLSNCQADRTGTRGVLVGKSEGGDEIRQWKSDVEDALTQIFSVRQESCRSKARRQPAGGENRR